MPGHNTSFSKTMKRAIDKDNYKPEQKFCCDCDQPINQRCHVSDVMNGKCGRCYRMNFRENERRCMKKTKTTERNNQRKHKFISQQY